MSIVCPGRKTTIGMKSIPKHGKYTPKCPKCGISFSMVVSADPDATMMIRPSPVEAAQPANALTKPKPGPDSTMAVSESGAGVSSAEATGDFTEPERAAMPRSRIPSVEPNCCR